MIERIHEAVQIIDESLAADDFNEEDREDLERNREFFVAHEMRMRCFGSRLLNNFEVFA